MSKTFYIQIGKEKVPVNEVVYRAFQRPIWAERKRWKVRSDRELSLDVFTAAGFEIPADDPPVEEIVVDKLMLDRLTPALDELTDDERGLIDALFFEDKSERKVELETAIPQKTINNRKRAILKKLKSFFE